MADFPETLRAFAASFDERFRALLAPPVDAPPTLAEAMLYAALAPGKRLRPFLVDRCCTLCGGTSDDALPAAAAIECVHAFSLVHDDLPAMDDDDLRRGRPTCHMQYGEANAILAGDALLALAFEILASRFRPDCAGEAVAELAAATGWCGMIGGQVADLEGESQPPSQSLVTYIHGKKTARLFEASCRLGALAADAGTDVADRLAGFGRRLGLAFQIADDLLDVTSDAATLGKQVGKDVDAGKQTLLACIGVEACREEAGRLHQAMIEELTALNSGGSEIEELKALCRFVIDRNY